MISSQKEKIQPAYTTAIERGNTMEMLGTARRFLRKLGHHDTEIDALSKNVMNAQSYNQACEYIRAYFPLGRARITIDVED